MRLNDHYKHIYERLFINVIHVICRMTEFQLVSSGGVVPIKALTYPDPELRNVEIPWGGEIRLIDVTAELDIDSTICSAISSDGLEQNNYYLMLLAVLGVDEVVICFCCRCCC